MINKSDAEEKLVLEAGNVMKVQRHQIQDAEVQVLQMSHTLDELERQDERQESALQEISAGLDELESFLQGDSDDLYVAEMAYDAQIVTPHIDESQVVDYQKGWSWEQYIESAEQYARLNDISMENDPYYDLMSKREKEDFKKRILEDYYEKAPDCDWKDYALASFCGTVAGLVDVFFVGMPGNSKLGNWTDKMADSFVCKRAEKVWDKNKKIREKLEEKASVEGWSPKQLKKALDENGFCGAFSRKYKGDNKPSGISEWMQFLEEKYKVPYDETNFGKFKDYKGGANIDLTSSNHHYLSLAHSPGLLGLVFSVIDQFFPEKTSFIVNGGVSRYKSIKVSNAGLLRGDDLISKIYSGIVNWFNHCISDFAGSHGSKAEGNRGVGLPNFGQNVFLFMDFGSIKVSNDNAKRLTIAQLAARVFESSGQIMDVKSDGTKVKKESYDLRHGMAMKIPVLLNEIMVRFIYTIRRHFFMKIPLKNCLPVNKSVRPLKTKMQPGLRRMLFVSYSVLCLLDDADAIVYYVSHGGNIIGGIMHLNYYAQFRFAQMAFAELCAKFRSGKIKLNDLMNDVTNNWERMEQEMKSWKPYGL